ncbi:MAG: GYD domain-containing protein [Desulfobacterota bacterium]|nr:GYD domain-containing protein [Thermodesulfobacteriota bacterium]
MPTYITLWKYTKEGLTDIKNTAERYKAVNEIINAHGGKVISAYGLIGRYDVMTIVELPDERALISSILKICSKGRVTSETLTAVSIEEFLKLTREA